MAQLGEGRGQRAALERERGRAAETLDRLTVELQELGPEADARKAVAAAEGAQKAAQGQREERQKADREAADATAQVKRIVALEASLIRQGAECETCGSKLTADKRQERAGALKTERGKLEAWLKKHERVGHLDLEGVAAASRNLDDAKRRLTAIGDRLLRHAEAAEELKALDAELGRTPAADPALQTELAEVRARIKKGQGLAGEASALNASWDRYDDSQLQWRKLSDEVVALERLCEALGPKGIGERLLRERFDGVLGKLNRVLARFGLEMAVGADPWALRFAGRPALLMSASERWRAGFCLQLAVGALTGAKLAIIDGVDILDPRNRGVFFALAKDAVAAGLVDQVICTGTLQDPAVLKMKWEAPVAAYHLPEPGRIERLG